MVFFYSNNPPRTTPMTTPISLKSTRLEILLEVTEDRGIKSGRWDLEQQITLPSVERVGVDLRKKRTGEWGSRSLSFLCSRCVWEKCSVGGHEGGVSEGYTESAKNLERGVRIHPHSTIHIPDSTFQIPEDKDPWRYQVSSPPSMPGMPILLLDKMWNACKPHSQKLGLQTL